MNKIPPGTSNRAILQSLGWNMRICIILVVLCMFYGTVWAANLESLGRPYSPNVVDPFTDHWRWSQIDEFSNYKLNALSEAPDGEIWAGTDKGVLRYDGYEVELSLELSTVRNIQAFASDDVYALSQTELWKYDGTDWTKLTELSGWTWPRDSVVRSKEGIVWVGLKDGLLRVEGSVVEKIEFQNTGPKSLAIDSKNRLWIARGAARLNRSIWACPIKEGRLTPRDEWTEVLPESHGIGTNFTQILRTDLKGEGVWLMAPGRDDLLRHFDVDLNERVVEEVLNPAGAEWLLDFVESSNDTLWFLGRNNLYSLNEETWNQHQLMKVFRGKPKLVFVTRDEHLLFAGTRSPLFASNLGRTGLSSLRGVMFQCEDTSGKRWYLGERGQVVVEDPEKGLWRKFDVRDGVIDTPLTAIASSDGTIWVAGSHGGHAAVSYFSAGEWTLDVHKVLGVRISHRSAYEARDGKVYFGSGQDWNPRDAFEGGLVAYQSGDNGYYVSRPDLSYLHRRIVSIVKTGDQEFWFGGQGLVNVNKEGNRWVDLPGATPNRWVNHIVEGLDQEIWAAVAGKGVYRVIDGDATLYSKADDLIDNDVSHLLFDTKDRLWCSTHEGISRFDGTVWSPLVLPDAINMGREEGTMKQSRDEAIWFNKASRSWFFRDETEPIQASIDFFGTTRYLGDRKGPETYLGEFESELHGVGNFNINWSGKDYLSKTDSEFLEYSHRIDGGEWSLFSLDTNRMFFDLGNGEHLFEIRARDQDGNVDQSPSATTIKVIPLLWKRPWFIATVLVVVIIIIGLIVMMVRMRTRHLVESREFKIWFFSEISHELKTPLSLILGPVESVLKSLPDGREKETLGIARRNARKMLRLVEQLLTFQKVEIGSMQLEPTRLDIVGFLRDTSSNFETLAEAKSLDLAFSSEREVCIASMDADKLQKIVDNLYSNAIKYTPEGGKVHCKLTIEDSAKNGSHAIIAIEDSGIGIPKSEQTKIFEPYHRASNGNRKGVSGTGVGLALARELVHVCGGSIEVESPVSGINGTRFTVRLPYSDDENIDWAVEEGESTSGSRSSINVGSKTADSPLVLLVDDNDDIRTFLRSELEDEFVILEAPNGKDGLALAKERSPDLVISDVMMPELDGNEFCRLMKSDQLTSHIPIILLTAKSSSQSELRGLEQGADDYLSKPVDTQLLTARIRNQLIARASLRARFVRETLVTPKEITVTPLDETILERAISIVEKRMQDHDFSVESLAEEMHLSRATLFRKLRAICGQNPTAFIATIRLKRSKQLLKKGSYTIAEVSHSVGFSDSSYFSSRFKKEFGITPTEFIAKGGDSG